jgi:hypothetical protein
VSYTHFKCVKKLYSEYIIESNRQPVFRITHNSQQSRFGTNWRNFYDPVRRTWKIHGHQYYIEREFK